MQKLLISSLCVASLLIGGCSTNKIPGVYRPDIQQGNVVTQEMVDKLRPGMTRQQVQYIMGTPLLVDVFHQDRWDYLYSIEADGDDRQQERISIFFEDDRLVRIAGDFRPMPAQDPLAGKETVYTVPDYNEREKGFFSRTMDAVGIDSDENVSAESVQEDVVVPEQTPEEQPPSEEQGFFGKVWDTVTFSSDDEAEASQTAPTEEIAAPEPEESPAMPEENPVEEETVREDGPEEKGFFSRMWDKVGFGSDEEE